MSQTKRSALIFGFFLLTILTVSLGCKSTKAWPDGGNFYETNDDTSTLTGQIKKNSGGEGVRINEDYYLWKIDHFFGLKEDEINHEDCESWMALWKEGKAFWAINIPDEAQILSDAQNPSTMILNSFEIGNSGVISQINLRAIADHQAWMEENLPDHPGSHWAALSGDQATATACRPGVTAKGGWKAELHYLLDFGGAKDAGAGAPTSEYYCYVGQDPPFFFTDNASARALFRLNAAQNEDITCVGPLKVKVAQEMEDWLILSAPVWYYDKPRPMQFRYHVYKPEEAYTIGWTIDSDIGSGWKLVFGNEEGPYQPQQPVSNPFTTTMSELYLWAVADMPENTADGHYTQSATFTVSAPANASPAQHDTQTFIWLGDWTPPGDKDNTIFMPMLIN